MKPSDLLTTAGILLASGRRRPSGASLRRATSSVYYALFHHLAYTCANLLIGGRGSDRSKPAWRQVYRSLDHGAVKDRCGKKNMISKFPNEIQDFANMFISMQQKRHEADYDPFTPFVKSTVLADVIAIKSLLLTFDRVPAKDRRAFRAYVLLRARG